MNLDDTPQWQMAEQDIDRAVEASERFEIILHDHLPNVIRRFARASIDYGDAADELGPRAQFVDINRKIRKLRKALWLGQPLQGEQPVEILDDLIAHCLLAREMLTRSDGEPVMHWQEKPIVSDLAGCQHYFMHSGVESHRCGKPTVGGSQFCDEHIDVKI